MTHATFRSALKRIGDLQLASNITKNLGIGLKIIDEAHLEFRDTLIMDFVFNVQRNLYLTATDARSSKSENAIFQNVFSKATYYKPSSLISSNRPTKWVEYNLIELNTNVNPNMYRYRIDGGRGMSPVTYGKYVIKYDKQQRHFKCIRDILKDIYDHDNTSKVIVFLPLIELCEDAAYFLIKALNYDESFQYDLNIKTIHSQHSRSENEENKHADVIITTIASCGTGTDIPGVTAIICASPYCSKVIAIQTFGRLRYCGKQCYYYDIYDASVKKDRYWMKSRRRILSPKSTKTNFLVWTDDENNNT